MTNRQRFPLLINGKRILLDAGVESSQPTGTVLAPWAYIYLDHNDVLAPMTLPAAGLTVPVNLPNGGVVTVVFGPAKAHYVSLQF